MSIAAGEPNCDPAVLSQCSPNARCINIEPNPALLPRYQCACFSSFSGDGRTCEGSLLFSYLFVIFFIN